MFSDALFEHHQHVFATDTCIEFDRRAHSLNWTVAENATSPVREFWE